jgi:uncharacterized protein (TIGR03435 family)
MNLHRLRTASIILVLAIIVFAVPLSGSTPAARQDGVTQNTQPSRVPLAPDPKFARFVYDVVSIKPFKVDPQARQIWLGVRETPDGFLAHSEAVFLIYQAFRFEGAGVEKPSGWIRDDKYDIEAKMEPEVAAALQNLSATDQKLARQHMLQVMLRDRFEFAYHSEPHEENGFDLVIAKNGSKLTQAAPVVGDQNPAPRGMSVRSPSAGVVEWDGRATKIGSMLGQLQYETGRTILDKTGLTGVYDFTLTFASERGAAIADSSPLDAAPALNTALEEQLGLKLVASKVDREFIVIDHIERPSSN